MTRFAGPLQCIVRFSCTDLDLGNDLWTAGMSASTPVCGPVGLKTRGGTNSATEAPFSFRGRGLGMDFVSGYHRTPLRKRVFGIEKKEPPLLQCRGEAPCSASGKMSRVGISLALEKTKALLAKARNLENLYPRKRNCFLPLRVAPA